MYCEATLVLRIRVGMRKGDTERYESGLVNEYMKWKGKDCCFCASNIGDSQEGKGDLVCPYSTNCPKKLSERRDWIGEKRAGYHIYLYAVVDFVEFQALLLTS